MPISDYCEWLAKQYDFSIYKLSFRNAVSRYIRAYGKGNYDEKHPLHIVSTETGEKATIALLKLFEQYKTIDDLESRVKKSADNLQTYTQAQAHNFVAKIGIRKYEQNKRDILKKTAEIEQLSSELDKGLLDLDSVASEQAIEIKQQLSHARRMRSRLRGKLSIIENNVTYEFSDTTETFSELMQFFPGVNIHHISEIEQFHRKIASIFKAELKNEKQRLQKQLIEFDTIIKCLEEQLDNLIKNPHLSKIVLQRHADALKTIEQMQRENESYEKTQELKRIRNEDLSSLKQIRSEQFGILEKNINTEMDRINGLLYSERYNPPILHFNGSNYTFHTPDDTGTGIAYKGLVVFDLAILHLTKLPILLHDSLILKQISDDAIENILQQYSESGKQVIIALDKQDSYSPKTSAILEENMVIKLAPNGEELFGRSWSKQSSQ